ncbi:CBS domain-containing protein [Rhizobium sp. Rhizsp42]|uniref:CBS domain-containing protein n=1 Tax=Rhizobium sp. Rhizsp42 TaxID=3243034 RepID=UPI000DD88A2A
MTIPAKSVMRTDVFTVSPETTVAEAARCMLSHHVAAVPVVDPDNKPLGVVSEGDVMHHFGSHFQSKRAQWLRLLAEGETLAPEFLAEIRLNQQRVSEIMHPTVISSHENASLSDLSDLMMKEKIKRVLILRDGVLVGIVSRADVIRAVVEKLGRVPIKGFRFSQDDDSMSLEGD